MMRAAAARRAALAIAAAIAAVQAARLTGVQFPSWKTLVSR